MEPEPVAEPTPAPASERPVRAAAQKAAQKRAEEAEAAAKKKAAGGKATAAALQKKLAAQKEAASAAEAAQKARIEELEAELLRQQVRAAEAGASPRSAYGTPAKGQGHVSEENDNLEVELEAALGDEGEGAGEGASAPEPSPETEPPKTPEAVYELVAANAERFRTAHLRRYGTRGIPRWMAKRRTSGWIARRGGASTRAHGCPWRGRNMCHGSSSCQSLAWTRLGGGSGA